MGIDLSRIELVAGIEVAHESRRDKFKSGTTIRNVELVQGDAPFYMLSVVDA